MSRQLVVEIPEEDQTTTTMDAYNELVFEKLEGDYDPELKERYHNYRDGQHERRLETLEAGEKASISLNVPRDCTKTDAWDHFVALFEPEEGDIVRTISDPAELDALTDILRSMKTGLEEISERDPRMDTSPEEWEIMFETGLISLPEFAREHGYGVWAPY